MSIDTANMSVTLDLGASTSLPFTLTNNGAGTGTFENSDLEQGYTPKRQGFLPAAVRPANPDKTPTSIGRAPNAPNANPGAIGKAITEMVGEQAYAVDVYPGYNLVTFTNDNPGAWTVVAGLPGNQYFAGDFIGGDFSTLYVIDYATNTLYTVDTATGAVTTIGPSIPNSGETWTGMTGSVDGTMYASSTNITRSTLYTVDLGTGAVTVVGEITNCPAAIDIAITPDGSMYAVDIVNDNLVQIDPATGAGTVIGYIGFNANYAQGMDYEEESGTLYLAAYSTQGELRIADPATGNTVLVGAFPGGAETDSLAFATGGGGDALWLSEDPVSGTVAPDGGTAVTDVTFDAGMVTQPGTYTGQVKSKTNDPVNTSFTINATMVVNAPANWGRLSGTVTGLGYCDADPAPLQGALVTIEGGLTVETDENGYYLLWLENGTYNVTVTADGHTIGYATVTIVGGQMTVQDFDLRWLQPCMSEEPASLEVTLDLGQTAVEQITLTNDGAAEGTFEAKDVDKGYLPLGRPVGVTVAAAPSSAPEGTAIAAGSYTARPAGTVTVRPSGTINQANVMLLAADDDNGGSSPIRDMLLAYGDLGAVDLFDPRYATPTLDQLLAYNVVVVWANYTFADANGIGNVLADYVDEGGKVIDLMFALDPSWGYQGRFRTEGYTAMTLSGTSYATSCLGSFDPSHPIMDGVTDVCDLYRGMGTVLTADSTEVARWQDNELFVAVKDNQTVATINGYVGMYYQWTGQMADVLHNAILWVEGAGGDALWLTEDPMAGTVAPDGGTAVIDVTFDASVVTQPGTYLAEITIKTNDPVNKKFIVPATMNVNGPSEWGRIEGIVSSLGHCDGNPVPLEGATVEIVGFGTLVTDENGAYSTWLPQGTWVINVTADGHVGDSAVVFIQPQQTTYQDFGLRLTAPCISVAPPALEVWVMQGATAEESLSIINSGAGASTFVIAEQPLAGNLEGTTPPARKASAQGGNPALTVASPAGPLAAPVPSAHPEDVLWDQPLSSANQNAYVNQDFSDVPDYSSFLADDFINAEPWNISTVFVPGNGWNGFSTLMNATSLTWQIYADNGGIPGGDPFSGGAVWSITLAPSDPQVVITTGSGGMPSNATLNLAVPVTVESGHWWLIFYPTMPFSGGGQYGRQPADTANGYWTQFKNPGGGFGYGTEWQSWAVIGADRQDMAFRLEGEVANLDVPWLSEDPTSGTVDPDSTFPVAVTFDSTGLALGDYFANLKVKTQDAANPTIIVPVTMHVVEAGASMHLADIFGFFSMDPYGRYLLRMKVGVHDADHLPLGYVAVDASITSPAGGPFVRTRMTKPSTGYASFPWGSTQAGVWQICVDGLTKAGYVYVPGDNDVPECAQWDNTP